MSVNIDRLKLEIKRARVPFFWLVFLVVAGIIAFTFIFQNQTFQRPWQSYYRVRAAFDSVKGVFPGGNQVRIAGVRVGVVTSEQLVDGKGVLTLSLDPKYGLVYRDATARIRPQTPLDDMFVDLDPGDPASGVLPKSAILPASQTVTPVDISRVLQTFDASTRQQLALLLDGLGRGLSDRGQQLQAAFVALAPFLHGAQRVTYAMAVRRHELSQLVSNMGVLLAALNRRDQQIASLVRDGHATLGALAAADRPLADMIAQFPPTLATLRSSMAAVRAAEANIDPALTSLHPVAKQLDSGLSALQRFATDAAPALSALRPTVHSLRPLAQNLRPTANSLAAAFLALRPQAPQLDQITADLVPCLPTLEHFLQWTLSVIKFSSAYGGIPRADTTFDTDTAGGVANGSNLTRSASCTDTIPAGR